MKYDALMNIVTGEVASPNVTVDDALSIAQSNMKVFNGGQDHFLTNWETCSDKAFQENI